MISSEIMIKLIQSCSSVKTLTHIYLLGLYNWTALLWQIPNIGEERQ